MFLKLSLAISFNLSKPYFLTISIPALSTASLAPFGILIPISLHSLSNSWINMYLLIKEAQATAKCLSSPLVKNVIFLTTC